LKNKNAKFWLLCICFFGAISYSFAQRDSVSVIEPFILNEKDFERRVKFEDTKVLAASRSYRNAEDLPFTIYVITKSEIEQNGYLTLVDALRNLPGFFVSQPGSALEGETFLARGLFGNYYTKILVDNLPVQPSAASGMPIGAQLPIKQAERIEVILGPAAAIYGADAMAGVINIVTSDNNRSSYANAESILGQFGFSHFNMQAGGKLGRDKNVLQYSFYGSATEMAHRPVTKGHDEVYNPSRYATIFTPFNTSPFYRGTETLPEFSNLGHSSSLLGASLKFRGVKLTYDFMNRAEHTAIGLQPNRVSYSNPNTFIGESIHRVALTSDYNWLNFLGERFSLYTNASWVRYQLNPNSSAVLIDDFNTDNPGLNYFSAASDDIYFEQLINYKISESFELLNGITAQYSGNLPFFAYNAAPFDYSNYSTFSNEISDVFPYNLSTYQPFRFGIFGAFSQLYFAKGSTNALFGLRYDYNTRYGNTLNPRVALNQKISSKLTAIGSFGSAFRVPSAFYQYNTFQFIFTPNNPATPENDASIIGSPTSNPFLTPENFLSSEFGFNLKLNEKIALKATGFYQLQTNLISNAQDVVLANIETTDPVTFRVGFVNDEDTRVELFGSQFNVMFTNLIERIRLGGNIFYTYTLGREQLAFNAGELNRIRNMPMHLVKTRLFLYPTQGIYLNFESIISSDFTSRSQFTNLIDGFAVFHFNAQFTVNKSTNMFFGVQNIFNERYGGIGATGRIGQDLLYNPQMARWVRLGVNFKLEK
jgi:outer membrane cobalamin receptor